MIRLKAFALFMLAFMCFSFLPFTLCYLDVASEQDVRELSSSSKENLFIHSLRHQEHQSYYNQHNAKHFENKTKRNMTAISSNLEKSFHTSFRHNHGNSFTTTIAPTQHKPGHHLRHHNRYRESSKNRVFPSLGQQYLKIATPESTSAIRPNVNNTKSWLFDQNSVFAELKTKTTSGPKSRHNYGSHVLSDLSNDKQLSDETHGRASAKEPEFPGDDYMYNNDDDYLYENDGGEDVNDELASNSGKWNNVEIMDPTIRREHRPSANIWMSSDEVENVYSRYNIPGKITQHKFEELGTHEAIKQSRKAHIINHMQHKAMANAHASKVYNDANCHLPQQRIERIQKDPSKIYVPHCTILYRCGDDTGCCKTDRQTCAPKKTQSIDLYFFVKSFNAKQGTIERHTFINHTECHCVDKTTFHLHALHVPEQIMRKATMLDCNCPKLFEKILQENGLCRCDCSSGNIGCNYLKRGMEHFSMVDRKCIIEGRCKPPTCEFGIYLKKHGRCQRNNEVMQQSAISWNYN